MVAEAVLEELRSLAPQIKTVEADLDAPGGERYHELEILSAGQLVSTAQEAPCSACGAARIPYPTGSPVLEGVPGLPLFSRR
jgi:hypothetical protein